MTPGAHGDWSTAPLVALDLEGSGAQDRDDEAILEIAIVPLTGGRPDIASAYSTLISPGRTVPRRPWISPGLTSEALAGAPGPGDVEPELASRVGGQVVVGHNVGVDWRLLHRRHPAIAPAALIDTLRLARHIKIGAGTSLRTRTCGDSVGTRPRRKTWPGRRQADVPWLDADPESPPHWSAAVTESDRGTAASWARERRAPIPIGSCSRRIGLGLCAKSPVMVVLRMRDACGYLPAEVKSGSHFLAGMGEQWRLRRPDAAL